MGSLVQGAANVTVVSETVGAISGLLGVATILPQVLKARNGVKIHGKALGVSLGTWLAMVASNTAWFGVALIFQSPSQIVTQIVWTVLAFSVVWFVLPRTYPIWVEAGLVALMGLVSMTVVLLAPNPVAYAYLSLFVLSRAPQIRRSYFTYKAAAPSDVSIMTWVVSMFTGVGWLSYGFLTGTTLNVVFSATAIVLNIVIVFYELGARKRRESRALTPRPEQVAL